MSVILLIRYVDSIQQRITLPIPKSMCQALAVHLFHMSNLPTHGTSQTFLKKKLNCWCNAFQGSEKSY